MSIRILPSQRGRPLLVYNNYKYCRKYIVSTGETHWTCNDKECRASLYTTGPIESISITRILSVHHHKGINEKELNRQCISNAVKRQMNNIDNTVTTKIMEQLNENPAVLNTFGKDDLTLVKRNFYRTKHKLKKVIASMVKFRDLLVTQGFKNNNGEDVILLNEFDTSIFPLSSKSALETLCESSIVLLDRSCTRTLLHSMNLFVIHGFKNGAFIPLVFVFYIDEQEKTYKAIFDTIKEACEKNNLRFDPQTIFSDSDKKLNKPIIELFPQAYLQKCKFHPYFAWWRTIDSIIKSNFEENCMVLIHELSSYNKPVEEPFFELLEEVM